MSGAALLAELYVKGARVTLDGEQLDIDAPAGILTPELLDELRAYKAEIIALLAATCGDCRPAHTQPVACQGRPFRLGAVMATAPGDYKVAIHCPVCCPALPPKGTR